MGKKLEIFKPGTFTDMKGNKHTFTEADVRGIAAVYDPALYKAPLVVGHPKEADPAFGDVVALEVSAEGKLLADPDNVEPAFAELVNAGRFSRISSSFYSPNSPNNPKPGAYYLRHVGFLGAMPPAVKGLAPASFADGEEGVIEFGSYEDSLVVRTLRGLKNLLIDKFGKDAADQAIDEYALESLQADALRDEMKPGTCSCCGAPCADCTCETQSTKSTMSTMPTDYSEGETMTKEELDQKERDLNAREAKLNQQESTKKHTDNVSFCEGLVQEGKLLPAQKTAAIAALDFAEGVVTGDTIEFGEGDAKKTQTPGELIRGLLSNQPKVIDFGEYDFSEEADPKGAGKEAAKHVDLTKYV